MIGAIAGDVIGSVYEGSPSWQREKTTAFEPLFHPQARFTDDTVLTVAVADALLNGTDLVDVLKDYARSYPSAGYGGTFIRWAMSESRLPYGSWANGSAMRVSPVGYAFDQLDKVVLHAKRTAEVTHNHPEGIKGAQAVASAVFLARTGSDKDTIRDHVEGNFGYDLGIPLDDLRPHYGFDVSCRGTVPPALRAFLEATDFESAVRLAVSLGGDADTLACIAGSVAAAFHGVPEWIREQALTHLDPRLREVIEAFERRYPGR